MNRTRLAVALALSASAGLLVAGPLNPPGGPVGPTYKTLSEVEPRTAVNAVNTPGDAGNLYIISQPGSYYLTAPISTNLVAIRITAANVTLDLNGFTVQNTGGGAGLRILGPRASVRNGVLVSTAAGACIETVAGASEARLSHLNARGGQNTPRLAQLGDDAVIADSTFSGGLWGILTVTNSEAITLSGVTVSECSAGGADLGERAVVDGCAFRQIAFGGSTEHALRVDSFSTVRNTLIADSVAEGPDRALFADGTGCVVEHCTIQSSGLTGISIGGRGAARDNSVTMRNSGAAGIVAVSGGAFVADNLVSMTGISPTTGVSLFSAQHTVVRNVIRGASTPIAGATALSLIGPAASNGNPTASTNPHANFIN